MTNELALAEVDFHGEMIQAAQDVDGTIWVPIRRICENLGLDLRPQERKLSGAKWAVRALMALTGSDGKTYEMSCISLKSLPMWLVKIEPSRVNPEIREKLERYQLEAADVLARHFLGESKPSREALPASELRQLVVDIATTASETACERVMSEVRGMLAETRRQHQPEAMFTVRERIEAAGWLTATPKDRDRVRALALRTIARAGFERPVAESTSPSAELLFPRRHLEILDNAIFDIWHEAREANARRATQSRQPELF